MRGSGRLERAALRYAEHSWYVFPVHGAEGDRCTCGRACSTPAKHPRTGSGVHDATRNGLSLMVWWKRWPTANVAVATGAGSGLVVLDVDSRHRGFTSLDALEKRIGELPRAPRVLTGGDGLHLYFAHPGGRVPNRSHLGGFRGLDLKGDGGYVLAPPSLHVSGRRYTWDPERHPGCLALPPLPQALLELAAQGPRSECVEYEPGPGHPSAEEILQHESRVRERFERSAAGLTDTSPSGVDFSLACALAWRGVEGSTIEALVRESRARAGLPAKRPSYYRATVGKALASAAEAAA